MPSGFYSGLCSDSTCQQGWFPPFSSTQGGTEPARKLAPTSPPGQIALHWLSIHRVTQEREGDLKTPALPQTGLLAWVLGLRGQNSPRKRKMAPQLWMCFYFQTLKLILVALQLPDTAKSCRRGYVGSLNLCLTSRAGLSMAFPIFQPWPCCIVRRNNVCFTTLFVALNEITYT